MKLSSILQSLEVTKERVILYMPMIPEVITAMLACARIGAIHSVVLVDLRAKLANRISDSKPKIILSASCGLESNRILDYKKILDKAISLSCRPQNQIIFQREELKVKLNNNGDLDWIKLMSDISCKTKDCVSLKSEDLYIYYTRLVLLEFQKGS